MPFTPVEPSPLQDISVGLTRWLYEHARDGDPGSILTTSEQFAAFPLVRDAGKVAERFGAARFSLVRTRMDPDNYPDTDEQPREMAILLHFDGDPIPYGDGDLETSGAYHHEPDQHGNPSMWNASCVALAARGLPALDAGTYDEACDAWANWGEDHPDANVYIGRRLTGKIVPCWLSDRDLLAVVMSEKAVAAIDEKRLAETPAQTRPRRRG